MRASLGFVRRHPLGVASSALALAVMLPLLRPGFTLVYDMVFVPHLRFSTDLLGISRSYPRSVPTDLWVALASIPLGGAAVQKLVLLFIVGGGAFGAGRLVPGDRALARLAAGVLYAWNPFVYERLLLGQWALLLGYALLPWAVSAGLAYRRRERGSVARLVLAMAALTAASPYSGLICGATALAVALWPPFGVRVSKGEPSQTGEADGPVRSNGPARRRALLMLGAILAVNLVWLVPTLVHPAVPGQPDAAVRLFRARSDSPLGTVGSVVSLGGMWRTDLAPPGRGTFVWIPAFALIAGIAIWGWVGLRGLTADGPDRPEPWSAGARRGLFAAAGVGLVLALAASFPWSRGAVVWLARTLPAGGFLRDGQKFVMPLALAEAVGFGVGVARVIDALPSRDRLARGLVLVIPLLPIALAPTLAWGAGGRLSVATYPSSWTRVEQVLSADRAGGAVLTLPWHAYLPFGWNHGGTVHQPAARFFSRPVLSGSALELGSATLVPEDPWARLAGRALLQPPPLAPRLPKLGVHWVLLFKEADWKNDLALVSGLHPVVNTKDLTLYRGFPAGPIPTFRRPPAGLVVAGDGVALATVTLAAFGARRRRTKGRHRVRKRPDALAAGDGHDT